MLVAVPPPPPAIVVVWQAEQGAAPVQLEEHPGAHDNFKRKKRRAHRTPPPQVPVLPETGLRAVWPPQGFPPLKPPRARGDGEDALGYAGLKRRRHAALGGHGRVGPGSGL